MFVFKLLSQYSYSTVGILCDDANDVLQVKRVAEDPSQKPC